jgi:hypothetical protein
VSEMVERVERAAAAIANARGGRRGMPPIKNILAVLPQKLVDEVMDDARAVLAALHDDTAPSARSTTGPNLAAPLLLPKTERLHSPPATTRMCRNGVRSEVLRSGQALYR